MFYHQLSVAMEVPSLQCFHARHDELDGWQRKTGHGATDAANAGDTVMAPRRQPGPQTASCPQTVSFS